MSIPRLANRTFRPARHAGSCALLMQAVLLSMLLASPARAWEDEAITLALTPDPGAHVLHVDLEWRTGPRGASTLSITRQWASVADPREFIRDLAISGADVVTEADHRWTVQHQPGATIRVSYDIGAGHASFDWDRHYLPIVSHKFFHGVGQTFLVLPDAADGEMFDVTVRWSLPEQWNAATPFGTGAEVRTTAGIRELRESVFLAGSINLETARSGDRTVTVAVHDLFRFGASDLASLSAVILDAECRFMGEGDFPTLLVTAIPVGDPLPPGATRRGGTGLHRSLALFLPPMASIDADMRFLLAHELFHAWNGGLLRPAAPEELVYWFTEGFTDYYAFRILHDLLPQERPALAQRINRQARRYAVNPARLAPNEEIRRRFWAERETFRELPYQRGLLLAIRWHAMARTAGVVGGIDPLMRALVDRARSGEVALSNQVIRETGIATLGEWFGPEFDRFADGGAIIDLPADALEPDYLGERIIHHEFELGFDADASLREKRVRGLLLESAAAEAGLLEGDRLTSWDFAIGDAGHEVRLVVRRDDSDVVIRYMPVGEGHEITRFQPRLPK